MRLHKKKGAPMPPQHCYLGACSLRSQCPQAPPSRWLSQTPGLALALAKPVACFDQLAVIVSHLSVTRNWPLFYGKTRQPAAPRRDCLPLLPSGSGGVCKLPSHRARSSVTHLWGPVRLHMKKDAPMPPHPALGLAKPDHRLIIII